MHFVVQLSVHGEEIDDIKFCFQLKIQWHFIYISNESIWLYVIKKNILPWFALRDGFGNFLQIVIIGASIIQTYLTSFEYRVVLVYSVVSNSMMCSF